MIDSYIYQATDGNRIVYLGATDKLVDKKTEAIRLNLKKAQELQARVLQSGWVGTILKVEQTISYIPVEV